MDENAISRQVIGAAIEVHRELGGPGLLEDIYEQALACELMLRKLVVVRQFAVPVLYKGHEIKKPLVLDLLISNKLIVEVKAVDKFNPIFHAQLLTYLRLTGLRLGLVVNFGSKFVKDGIYRVVNGLPEL